MDDIMDGSRVDELLRKHEAEIAAIREKLDSMERLVRELAYRELSRK